MEAVYSEIDIMTGVQQFDNEAGAQYKYVGYKKVAYFV
jgi:hypothetical protein